jgi:hypothetical protein
MEFDGKNITKSETRATNSGDGKQVVKDGSGDQFAALEARVQNNNVHNYYQSKVCVFVIAKLELMCTLQSQVPRVSRPLFDMWRAKTEANGLARMSLRVSEDRIR